MSINNALVSATAETDVFKERLSDDKIIEDPLHDYVPTKEELSLLNKPYLSRSTSIYVAISSPCDQVWRGIYPDNWMWQANRAIVNADQMLNYKFGIELYSVAQKYWNSSSTTPKDLVFEAKNEWGLTDGADIMIAFTGKKYGTTMGRVSEIGQPYIIILDHQFEYNRETVQHEVGHSYGLKHFDYDYGCVMISTGMGHIDTLCPAHEQEWNSKRYKY